MNAAAHAQKTETQRLNEIRASLTAIAPAQWSRAADDMGEFIEARDEHGEFVSIARFQPGATIDEIEFAAASPSTVAFLLGLVDRAIVALRQRNGQRNSDQRDRRAAIKDFAAEAAMKCQEPAFKAFLEDRHGLERPLTDDRAAQKLRSVLGITSRKELNEDEAAAARWKQLRADFYAWRSRN